MGILNEKELNELGFKSLGNNVKISDKASIYNPSNITIGNNVRIDDFVVISAGIGGIDIGNYIHIAVYSSLIGAGKITLFDYSNISSRVAIYSSNDDYSGDWMTNPMVPTEFTNVKHADVIIGKHVIIGSGSVILPGTTLHEGVALGALSMATKDCEEYGIYSGVPAKRIKERNKNVQQLEKKLSVS